MVEEFGNTAPSGLDGAFGGLSQQVFELGKNLFDRVQIRTVGRQEQQVRPRAVQRSLHLCRRD